MSIDRLSFRAKVEQLMATVPAGRVCTYGDLAVAAGHPYAARIVGGIAHYGDVTLPWHRLVNRVGGLAAGFPGGRDVQRQLLEREGVECDEGLRVVRFRELRWLFVTR